MKKTLGYSVKEAFKILNENYKSNTTRKSQARRKISEASQKYGDIIAFSGSVWNPEFFAEEVEDYKAEMEDNRDQMLEDAKQSVVAYYAIKNLPSSKLMVKKIFVLNPKFYIPEITTDSEVRAFVKDVKLGEVDIPSNGFELANGDYLCMRLGHDIGASYIKCRNYESMVNHLKEDADTFDDVMNPDDIIEESVRRSR